jgi:hypothetical protein
MAKSLKRGPMSKDDRRYLSAHRDLPIPKLAEHLNRTEDAVRKHLEEVTGYKAGRTDFIEGLHDSAFWSEVRKGLLDMEIDYFEQAWTSYTGQFSASTDILPTDELMIKDLIMLDIFAQRAIGEQANVARRIKSLQEDISKEERFSVDNRDQMKIADLRTQINSLYAAKSALAKQHLDYQQRKDAKLRDLKGSRDQRFKQIEESRRNIFELIKDLDQHRRRIEEGRIAEKVKIAAERTAKDWQEYHTYEDGEVDKPFLCPEGEI